ncbi:MAG: hypothetical protein QXH51_06770 [Candidatus Bathyarchaeia archaeon]
MSRASSRVSIPFREEHGPYAPCPMSPTGEHCWHSIGAGVRMCCRCGRMRC